MQVIVHTVGADKGLVKRSPQQEAALRVRILNDRHLADVHERACAELGRRIEVLGPIDLTRNPLKAYTRRSGRAYQDVPMSDTLDLAFVAMIGDSSSHQTIEDYGKAGGTPMPSELVKVSQEALWNRRGANFAGTMTGWDDTQRDLFVSDITPDDLEVEYRNDSPREPIVVRHFRNWKVGTGSAATWKRLTEVYDLTDLDNPSYRIMDGEADRTPELTGRTFEGDDYWWRYEDGTPFHRIVVSGNPREPYRNVQLVEGTLKVCVLYTHWAAGVRDAGHPQRWAIGLIIHGQDSDATTGQQGAPAGPETLLHASHKDPENPGSFHQDKPGFDPEVVGKAVRNYEMGLLSALGLPVDPEGTGGDPTNTELEQLRVLIQSTFAECRWHDGQVLRRLAATANRASEMTEGMEPTRFDETAPGVLYLWQVESALIKAGVLPDPNAEKPPVEE